jgi:YggT family protein
MAGFIAVGYFLISIVFDLILFTLWTRVALRYFRVSSLNQFSRLIYTLTAPVITPIYSMLRYQDRAQQKYDWPVFIVIFLVEVIKISLLSLIVFQKLLPFVWIIIYALADFIAQPCNLLFYALLIRVIMSYANPNWRHPFSEVLIVITEPLLILGRKIIPDISGFDFSPLLMMAILKIITLFIHASLPVQLL